MIPNCLNKTSFTTIGWSIRNSCTPGWPQLWSIVFPRAPESMTPSRASLTPIPWWVLVWRWSPWSFSWLSGSVVKFQSGTVKFPMLGRHVWDDKPLKLIFVGMAQHSVPQGCPKGCASQYLLEKKHNWLHPERSSVSTGLWTSMNHMLTGIDIQDHIDTCQQIPRKQIQAYQDVSVCPGWQLQNSLVRHKLTVGMVLGGISLFTLKEVMLMQWCDRWTTNSMPVYIRHTLSENIRYRLVSRKTRWFTFSSHQDSHFGVVPYFQTPIWICLRTFWNTSPNHASCLEKNREESDGATKLPPHLDKEFGCLCVCLEIGVYPPKWHFNGG